MIGWLKISNIRSIKEETEISFLANPKSKYLLSNTVSLDGLSTLKSLSLFGANNSGKTSFIKAVYFLKGILMGRPPIGNFLNIYSADPNIGISLLFNNQDGLGWMEYGFLFNPSSGEFSKEWLKAVDGKRHRDIFLRDIANNDYRSIEPSLADSFALFSKKLPLLYAMDIAGDNPLYPYKNSLLRLSDSIEIVDMYNIDLSKTISLLQGDDIQMRKAIGEFVKNADLSISDFSYGDESGDGYIDELSLSNNDSQDPSRLYSEYNGRKLPSMYFDSTGSKKIEALSGYIIEALKMGKTLFVDELDSGLHFKLTRAIVASFNNPLNKRSQLCFSSHDVSLLDTKRLFRKEQIYFCFPKADGPIFKRLSEYRGVRGNTLLRQYANLEFGEIPNPTFIDSLFDLLYEGE